MLPPSDYALLIPNDCVFQVVEGHPARAPLPTHVAGYDPCKVELIARTFYTPRYNRSSIVYSCRHPAPAPMPPSHCSNGASRTNKPAHTVGTAQQMAVRTGCRQTRKEYTLPNGLFDVRTNDRVPPIFSGTQLRWWSQGAILALYNVSPAAQRAEDIRHVAHQPPAFFRLALRVHHSPLCQLLHVLK